MRGNRVAIAWPVRIFFGNKPAGWLFDLGQQRQSKENIMFLKILAVSALSIGLATSALAQQSSGSGSGNGSGSNSGSTSGSSSGSGSNNGSSGNNGSGTSNNGGSNSNGSGTGTSTDGGKASDCNGMSTTKNTTNMKQDQAANPAATSNCP
ncbi:oxidoreductase [Rhizobium sp. P38BS-XIX]|uniref:oxidoreductase n=1 Tax=Rhizobium sp. P38BS-XIX TaxID=2726740 RepID=UPI0014567917|nr:oxidoreductase [Rhizobium sp. P38BS-XIX]NLS00683.1 oxidoreductase [Rhizobium sp. P38BS-XIX]